MKVSSVTFYQAVKIGRKGYNTIYESDEAHLRDLKVKFLPSLGLIQVTSKEFSTVYVGLANVRCFQLEDGESLEALTLNKIVENTQPLAPLVVPEGVDLEPDITPGKVEVINPPSIVTKDPEDMTEEDQRVFYFEALKRLGVNPHPMTKVPKLKEKLTAALEAKDGQQ